jgi:hypothetical protein
MPSWPPFASVALICCLFCSFFLGGYYHSDRQTPALGVFHRVGERKALPQPRCASRGHDDAHGAFMTLPPYTCTSEGEVHQLGSSPKPWRLSLGARKRPRYKIHHRERWRQAMAAPLGYRLRGENPRGAKSQKKGVVRCKAVKHR